MLADGFALGFEKTFADAIGKDLEKGNGLN